MSILISVLVKILEWLLVLGGRAAFEWADKKVEEHKQAKRQKENLKDIKDAIASGDKEKRHEATRRLLNGEKK